jgi:hypothetical protein
MGLIGVGYGVPARLDLIGEQGYQRAKRRSRANSPSESYHYLHGRSIESLIQDFHGSASTICTAYCARPQLTIFAPRSWWSHRHLHIARRLGRIQLQGLVSQKSIFDHCQPCTSSFDPAPAPGSRVWSLRRMGGAYMLYRSSWGCNEGGSPTSTSETRGLP